VGKGTWPEVEGVGGMDIDGMDIESTNKSANVIGKGFFGLSKFGTAPVEASEGKTEGGGVEGMAVGCGIGLNSNHVRASLSFINSFSRGIICEQRLSIASSRDIPSEIAIMAFNTQSSSCTRI
jgi:hypothetical protein